MLTVNFAIFLPFLAAILIPFIYSKLSRLHIGWIVLAVPAIIFIGLVRHIPAIASGETYLYILNWIPSFNINLHTYLDGLSIIFGLLISGIGVLVVLYSIYYLSAEESLKHFYVYLLMFMGAMLGVVFSDHMMVLYAFWELTSISSFLLIAFWYHRKGSRYGAKKSLLITVSGGIAMLAGFLVLHVITDTYSIREIISGMGDLKNDPLFPVAMVLILLGAFTKSAQFPFHIWLPDAMEAPTPVSAYLHSATMVKAGIYLVARFTPVFGGEGSWFWIVTGVGLMTMFWGSFSAIRQTDLKALLAYSTVSQLGLIMSLFGISSASFHTNINIESTLYTQAAFAALFHLVNHSTFKGALFMVVGIVDYQVGTRDIRRLGGLISLMPVTFTVSLIGSFSMAGLPPFNGFLSKEMFLTAVLNVSNFEIFNLQTIGFIIPVIAWVASVLTFIYCMIIVFKTFLGPYQEDKLEKQSQEPAWGMLVAPVTLAILVIMIFLFPNVIGDYVIRPAMASIYPLIDLGTYEGHHISAWHGFQPELYMTIAIIILGFLLYKYKHLWEGIYSLFPEKWSFDALYNNLLTSAENATSKITSVYMTGFLRHYLLYIYIFLVFTTCSVLFYTGAFSFNTHSDTHIQFFEWIIVIVIFVAAISILFAKTRLTAILLNGVIGFSMAMLFILFRAPDLALTQIVVETVTTALFLLCFYFLPEWEPHSKREKGSVRRLLISISVGLTFVLIALSIKSEPLFETISSYFEDSFELAGGNNIVNAILGDFRAFDTMLEVVVLFIAGIGVYSIIKMKDKRGARKIED